MSAHTHRLGRRRLLRATAAACALPTGLSALLSAALSACAPRGSEPQAPVGFEPGKPLPWINWGGNLYCFPATRAAPASEAELVDVLKNAKGVVRAVGAGHSFSAVVPTDDTLVSTDLLSGLVSHDPKSLQAEIWAGTRMHDLGPILDGIGQALPNMADMDYLAMGGAIANSAHATGVGFGSMSSYVAGLTLATPSGELIECDADRHRQLFQAARSSLGVLGIATRLKLQNQPSFRLTETDRVENTDEVIDDLAARRARHRHFEFLPLPHSALCVTVATDPAGPNDAGMGEDDPEAVLTLRRVFETLAWLPGGKAMYDRVLTAVVGSAGNTVRTGASYEVFPHIRTVRFREMEYTVPAEAGGACVREVLQTIQARKLPVCMPLEVRFVKGDDIWLSMFEGRDGCAISVHQYGDLDYRAYFAEIEPIFWKYEGRPHWGKIHTLDARRLAALYPRHWRDFQEVRRTLDPQGRMLNPHLKFVLGA